MRIAIATDWFPPRRGGIESQLVQLATALGARGHDVDVLTTTPDARDGDGFRVRPLRVALMPGIDVAMSPALVTVLRREIRKGYDVVHTHVSVVSPVGYAAAAVARALDLPTVVTFHSILRYKQVLLRAVDAVTGIGRGGTVWSAVSDLVAGQVRSALSTPDVAVLSNGIDVGFWRAARSAALAGPPSPTTLISSMRLHRKKRPRALVRAFAQAARQSAVPATLWIAGEGPDRAELEDDIRGLGLTAGPARVELLGWLSPTELRERYALADGFVLPSTREAFGIAALEASTAGLPVVAMREAGCTEFLTHDRNALLCVDDAELAVNVSRLLSDAPLRERLRTNAGSLSRYDWPQVIARHEQVYGLARTRRAVAAGVVAPSS